jgi:hypothetical protein
MALNFDEILLELSYRVPEGYVDLTKDYQVTELSNILKENGYKDAFELANKARVYFSYLAEADQKVGASSTFKGYFHRGGGYYSKQPDGEITHKSDAGTLRALTAKEKADKNKGVEKPSKPSKPTKPPKVDIGVSSAEKDKENKKPKEVNVEKGVAVAVPKQKYGTTGSKTLDQNKASNRNKFLPPSGISTDQAVQNFKKAYPGKVTTKYDYPPKMDKFLQGKLPPAGYDALKSLLRMSKQGTFEPPIGMITDQYGAGQVSAQANELAMQAVYSFPSTKEGLTQRAEFIKSLEENANLIEKSGGVPILDKSWIKQMAGAHDAFIKNMNRQYGEGNWEVTGMTWDVRAQQEALGANYDEKGDSTDMNAQVRINGEKITNIEISCKKDWQIYLLNAGLGDAENWFYTLGPEKEQRANELKNMKDAEDPRFTKEDALELKKLSEQALTSAPVKNKELQEKQMASAEKGFLEIREIPSADLGKAIKACQEKGQNDPLFIDKNDAELVRSVGKYLSKTKTLDVDEFRNFLGTKSEKDFKKAVLVYNRVLAEYTGDTEWIDSHRKITYDFMKQSAEKLATDKEFQGMLLRKLQEAIPMKTMVEGIETMQIDGMYITQAHMEEMFGTSDWNSVKEFLSIKVVNGIATIIYSAKSKKPEKPIKLASIEMREKGVGYNGVVGLQCKPTKDFEDSCREIDEKINKKR